MLSPTDPLFTLHTSNYLDKAQAIPAPSGGSSVTGVCFVRDPLCRRDGGWRHRNKFRSSGSSKIDSNSDDSDNDNLSCSSSSLTFQCSNFLLGRNANHDKNDDTSLYEATHISAGSNSSLSGGILASCHLDGTAKLWDLSTRRCIVRDICHKNRSGAGLALRRLGNARSAEGFEDTRHQFLYQTRDPMGTVTLHDLNRPETHIVELYTHSTTFCTIAPCQGGYGNNDVEWSQTPESPEAHHLVALPNEAQSTVEVRDLRCDPGKSPAWKVTIGEDYKGWQSYTAKSRYYGMVTSLALCLQEPSQRIVLGCGMEDGSILFHDLGGSGRGREPWWIGHEKETKIVDNDLYPAQSINQQLGNFDGMTHTESRFMCRAKVADDPVLCLDLVSSRCNRQICNNETVTRTGSLVAVSGCAGDADTMVPLPNQDQGTVTTIKVELANENPSDRQGADEMKATVRKRTKTCSLSSGGKVGVSTCRFRPDGRIFGVGGWDHRLRIFGRTSSKPLAVLHGHNENVVALDWAQNSAVSGLVATGAADGRICVYRIFPHSLRDTG